MHNFYDMLFWKLNLTNSQILICSIHYYDSGTSIALPGHTEDKNSLIAEIKVVGFDYTNNNRIH